MNTTTNTNVATATNETPAVAPVAKKTGGRPREKFTRALRIVKSGNDWIFPGRGRSEDGTEVKFITVPFNFYPAPKTVIDLSNYTECAAPAKAKVSKTVANAAPVAAPVAASVASFVDSAPKGDLVAA